MMVSLVTTSPMITRSNGAVPVSLIARPLSDNCGSSAARSSTLYIYKCGRLPCATRARLPLRGRDLTKDRTRIPAEETHDPARREGAPIQGQPEARGSARLEDRRVAADRVPVERDVAAMLVNRIIDNAAVAIGAINRHPVVAARDMALGHPRKDAATVFGVPAAKRVSPEWAAWANGTAVRELDMHDTFLAQDYSHPGDNIPPDSRGGADRGEIRPRSDPRPRHRLRDPYRPGARDLAAQAQDRPHHPSLPRARPPASARCSASSRT